MAVLAAAASPYMWLPFAAYLVAVLAAIVAAVRSGDSAAGDVAPQEDRQPDQQ